MPGYVIFLLYVGVPIALAFFYAWLAVRRRRRDMARLADRLGYEYLGRDGEDIANALRSTTLFGSARGRRVWNLLSGRRDGLEVSLFDYSQSASARRGSWRRWGPLDRSVVLIGVPGASFPVFLLRREGVLDKVKAAAGLEDIDFESAEFSRRYYVSCTQKRFAYDVLTQKQMKLLLSVEDMNVEICARSMVFYLDSTLTTHRLKLLHNFAMEFVANIPSFVLANS